MLKILVTGAAGLIGGELCARLAARGHAVTALVHKARDVRGNDGSLVKLASSLRGDVTQAGLGLATLPTMPDLVIHCAASLLFDAPGDDLARVNVRGTSNVAAFALKIGAPLIHVSTAYVCGLSKGRVTEAKVSPTAHFANGYEASKAEAEHIVRASGVRHIIARPSVVLGDSATGRIRQFDTVYNAFRLIARGMVRQMPVTEVATLDFVPIDHVTASLVALAERLAVDPSVSGAICHLASCQPIAVSQFAATIAAFPQFCAPELVDASNFDPSLLSSTGQRLHQSVASAYASYFQRSPHFCDARLRALTGLQCPKTGAAYLHLLIEHCIERGFLPAAASAHQDNAAPAFSEIPAPKECQS